MVKFRRMGSLNRGNMGSYTGCWWVRISRVEVMWWDLRWCFFNCRRMGGMNCGVIVKGSMVSVSCIHYVRKGGRGDIWSGNSWCIINIR